MKDEMEKADKSEGLAAEVKSNCEIAVRHLLVACAGLYFMTKNAKDKVNAIRVVPDVLICY